MMSGWASSHIEPIKGTRLESNIMFFCMLRNPTQPTKLPPEPLFPFSRSDPKALAAEVMRAFPCRLFSSSHRTEAHPRYCVPHDSSGDARPAEQKLAVAREAIHSVTRWCGSSPSVGV